jgi:hypothetical protein
MFTHHLITRSLVGGLVAAGAALGVAAVPASALPYDLNANGSYVPAQVATWQVRSRASQPTNTASPVSCGDVCSGHGYGTVSSLPTTVRVSAGSSGFDWGDAGIGAGGSAVLLGAGLLGAGMARRRRPQQPVVN